MIITISILTALLICIFDIFPKLAPDLARCPLGMMIGLFGLVLFFADVICIIIEACRLL